MLDIQGDKNYSHKKLSAQKYFYTTIQVFMSKMNPQGSQDFIHVVQCRNTFIVFKMKLPFIVLW